MKGLCLSKFWTQKSFYDLQIKPKLSEYIGLTKPGIKAICSFLFIYNVCMKKLYFYDLIGFNQICDLWELQVRDLETMSCHRLVQIINLQALSMKILQLILKL